MIESRISNPASSTATASRWYVRVPPIASMYPPGFRTRSTAFHVSGSNATPDLSQSLPMNPSS